MLLQLSRHQAFPNNSVFLAMPSGWFMIIELQRDFSKFAG